MSKEWKCGCGKWISAGWWRHSHVTVLKAVSASDMVAARMRGDLDPLAASETACDTYLRTGKEPTRIVEDGC